MAVSAVSQQPTQLTYHLISCVFSFANYRPPLFSSIGFCTPGIVVAIYSLFANNSSQKYIEEHLDGNLCRCTGYRPIWDAAKSLCTDNYEDGITTGPCGTACKECPERESCEMECNVQDKAEEKKETEATMCCSGTADKISKYKDSAAKDDSDAKVWLDQPSNLFPDALMSPPDRKSVV